MSMTWRAKLHAPRSEKLAVLDKPFAGVPAGPLLYVSTPLRLRAVVEALPAGAALTVEELRGRLAEERGATATCPVTTAMFLRVVAEAAWEELRVGRLACGPAFVEEMRRREAAAGGGP